jgi:hypothetical protein
MSEQGGSATMTVSATRRQAAEAFVRCLQTGEGAAAAWAARFLAPDVVWVSGQEEVRGRDAVQQRLTGQWPLTPVYRLGVWSFPQPDGDRLTVRGTFPLVGAAPQAVELAFWFTDADQIARVEQRATMAPPPAASDTIPDVVRALVNNALANGTPMVVAYVDEQGQPVLSLRGSTQVYSDHELCLWARNPDGGLVRAAQRHGRFSLLYRDSRTRSTLIFQGQARVATDPAERERVYALAPEVEQNHDPARRGVAVIIAIDRLQGTTPLGAVRMQRAL